MIFFCPGVTSTSSSIYIRNFAEASAERGYDTVVINYRGLAGAELTSPKFCCSSSFMDVLEPMRYVYDKYCRDSDRKVFAIGGSMGANILANLIGHEGKDCFIDAAFIV